MDEMRGCGAPHSAVCVLFHAGGAHHRDVCHSFEQGTATPPVPLVLALPLEVVTRERRFAAAFALRERRKCRPLIGHRCLEVPASDRSPLFGSAGL
eukprot:225882-Prorocentrum_minimum.AAC.1